MSQEKEIRVVGFITNNIKDYFLPVPDNYLADEKNIPKELIESMKKNGWQDKNGQIWWSKDFQPSPRIGSDGNIYLCLSDADVEDPLRCAVRMHEAKKLLISNLH